MTARRAVCALTAGLVVATIGVSACSSSKSSHGSGAGAASGSGKVDTANVTVAWNSTPDEAYLPLLMAIDAMKKQGYNIDAKTLSGSDISFQSLATNSIQFTADSLPPGALSVSQGAPVRILDTRNANLVVWVADSAYEDCSKLNGKPVGIYSETGGYTVLMKLYFAKHCPGVKPQYVTIPDSPVRAQAVATGRLMGTALGLPDALALQKKYPNKKLYLLPLKEDLPGVGDEYVYSNKQTISSHPSIVQALLSEQLKAIRSIYASPSTLRRNLVKQYLPSAADDSVAQQFVQQHIWYANGGLAGPGLPNTLKAFSLPGDPSKLQDTAPLDAVLAKIGKSSVTQY